MPLGGQDNSGGDNHVADGNDEDWRQGRSQEVGIGHQNSGNPNGT